MQKLVKDGCLGNVEIIKITSRDPEPPSPEYAASSGGLLAEGMNLGDALVAAFTVSDFPLLFSRGHLLPLIVFAALFGLAVALLGKKVPTLERIVEEGGTVVMKMMELVMKLAPIGIGCYFADTVGQLGGQIAGDYLQIFLVVCTASIVFYLLFYTLCALFCRIPLGKFWKEMLPTSATAVIALLLGRLHPGQPLRRQEARRERKDCRRRHSAGHQPA